MSKDRYEIAKKVLRSLKSSSRGLDFQIVVIDNGSRFKIDSGDLPERSTYFEMPINLGYWGLLYWALFSENSPLASNDSQYIYIIESDHIHYAFGELSKIVNALNVFEEIASARVQEFSIKFKYFYSKEARFLPFRKKRSYVSLRNAVTKERAKFDRIENMPNLYKSNLHSRLPSVFRMSVLRIAFNELARKEQFSEYDFFEIFYRLSPTILIFDKGIYYPASSAQNSKKVLSGSWLGNYDGNREYYKETRVASFTEVDLHLKPIHCNIQ